MRTTDTQSLNSNCLEQGKDTKIYNIDTDFEALKEEIKDHKQTELELQEQSLAGLLESIPPVNFQLEKEPKLNEWRKEATTLAKTVLDTGGHPIDEESEDFIKYEKLKKRINSVKVRRQEYSVLVINVFKKMVLAKELDLKVFNKEIFFYNGKYWQNITEERFTSFLSNVADKMGLTELVYEHHTFGNDLIKQFTHKNFVQFVTDSKYTCINLQNGTFKFFKGKGQLHPHNKKDNLHYVLTFDYLPEATCPMFIDYLEYCLPDEDKRKVLQEFIGYVFTPNEILNLEKCLLLYGSGSNGKSVLNFILNAIFGKTNVSSISIPQMTDSTRGEYYIILLQNILLNYCSDTKGAFDDTGVFKQLVSGEKVIGRHPAGRPVEFLNNAKFIFNVNSLPTTPENVHGFFRRFEIIDFNVTIEEEKKDRQLASKIIENELSGVLNWILIGLDRLLTKGKLTECKANIEALERFKIKSNNVLEFLLDEGFETVTNIEHGQIFNELYQSYVNWIVENGGHALKKSNFKDRIDAIKLEGKQVFRKEQCNGNKHKVNISKKYDYEL
jgi:putative DNA primase/helicase